MAKLSVFAAVFAALIAIAAATTYTTTVVTEINRPDESCEAEVQQMRMTECMQYVGMGMGRPPYEPSFLRSEVANPRQGEEHLEECCDEMKSVSSPCRGDAMRHMVKEMKKVPGMEGMEMQKMMSDKVRGLTQKCGLKRSPYMI